MRSLKIFLLGALLVGAAPLLAVSWTQSSLADFNAGSSDGQVDVVASGGGALRLAKLAGSLGSFQSVTPLPCTEVFYEPWTFGNRVFLAGGYQNGVAGANIYSNDVDASGNFSATWTLRGVLPANYANSGVARWMDRLYIGGGSTDATGVSSNLIMASLDSTGLPISWQSVGPLPVEEADGHFIAAQGKLFYFAASGNTNAGGTYARNNTYSAPILADGTLGSWTLVNTRPMQMRAFSTNYIADRAILVGGEDGSWTGSASVVGADIGSQGSLGAWAAGSALTQPRSYFTGGEGDAAGKLFILGGKTYPPSTTWATVYSAPVSASGTVGAWSTEGSLPQPRMQGSWLALGGKLHYFGGNDYSGSLMSSVVSASLNQGSGNVPVGSFAGRFDLGSDQAISYLSWTSNAPLNVQLQARVASSSGVFGSWSSLTNSANLDLSAQSPARYIEYRAKLTDGGSGDVELYDVTLNGPVPTPTITPTPTCAPFLPPYSGPGQAGDILLSLRAASSLIVRLDSSPGGSYSPYADLGDFHLDGITTDFDDNSRVRISREDSHDIVLVDGSGSVVPGQTWTFPAGVQPKIGAFDPLSGDYYVPDLAGKGLWSIKHGTTSPVMLPGSSSTFQAPLCSAFDNNGNLYLSDTLGQKVYKYSAASLAAWSSSALSPTPSVYADAFIQIYGMAFDGSDKLYLAGLDGVGLQLVTVGMSAVSGTVSASLPVWPALPGVPPGTVGTRLNSVDGVAMDFSGKIWMVQNDMGGMHGLVQMDTQGIVTDWRPLTVTGTPDDLGIAGMVLPHGYYSGSCNTPTPTPTRTPTPVTTFSGPGACPVTPNPGAAAGAGSLGDILIATTSAYLAGFNPATEAFYLFGTAAGSLDGAVDVDLNDPSKLRLATGGNMVGLSATGASTGLWASTVSSNLQTGAFAADGSYWVADQSGNRVFRIPAGGGTGQGKYFSTGINAPSGCAFDTAGNLYVSDALGAQGILKVAAANLGSVTMSATVLATGMINGGALVYDGDHSLYMTSTYAAGAARLYRIDTITGATALLASNFAPLSENGGASLYASHGVALGLDGALYIVQNNGARHGVLKMDINGTPLKYYNFPALIGGISTAAWTANALAVWGSAGVRACITATPTPTQTPTASFTMTPVTTFSGPGACPATPSISAASYSGVGSLGDILISTFASGYLVGFNPSTEAFYLRASNASNISGDIENDPSDPSKILVVVGPNVYRYDANGTNLGLWASTAAGNLQLGEFAPDGSYWAADQVGNKLYHIPAGGGTAVAVTLSLALNAPTACVFDKLGNMFVSDSLGSRVLKVIPSQQALATPAATVLFSGLLNVYGMAYDGDHTLYFNSSSTSNSTLYKADTISGVTTLLDSNFAPLSENGGGALYHAGGAVFGLDGALYVAQNQNPGSSRGILKLDSNGTPLKFYKYPATIGGISTSTWWADGLVVQGLSGNRVCAVATGTPSNTPSLTASATPTPTRSASPTATPTQTASPSATASPSPSPTRTPSPTMTRTRTPSPSSTVTMTASASPTPSVTQTPMTGLTSLVTFTSTSTPTLPVTPEPTVTPIGCRGGDCCIQVESPPPGSDGPAKTTIRADKGGLCSVRVYRPEGRICKRVWQGPMSPKEQRVVVWDADDEAGQRVASGIYTAVFTDGDGKTHHAKIVIIR